MKKLILLVSILVFTSACTNINKIDYKDNINNTIKDNYSNKIYNHSGNGYKYYLPKYMNVKNIYNNNEIINSNDNTYYLYVDVISFYNNKDIVIEKKCNDKNEFKYKNKTGYICINEINEKYLVEIVYNYAKIEVKVDKIDLNTSINNSIIILSTIKYDKDLIGSLIKDEKLNNKEMNLNLFGDKKSKEDFIDVVEEYDTYDEKENDIPDYDVIN